MQVVTCTVTCTIYRMHVHIYVDRMMLQKTVLQALTRFDHQKLMSNLIYKCGANKKMTPDLDALGHFIPVDRTHLHI
jgi:hypothetical protein